MGNREWTRRTMLGRSIGAAIVAAVAGPALGAPPGKPKKAGSGASEPDEVEVTPAEDLMREHGVLKRALLIYDECASRLDARREPPPKVIVATASLIRGFIEDYHERLEEEHLFPRFRKSGLHVDLVNTLEAQHKAGRQLTERILQLAKGGRLAADKERGEMAALLRRFVRMYAPHEAREDTVLFPAIRRIVSASEYDALGEDFEKKEHELFGDGGFEGKVDEVASLEKDLGIYDLAGFTPAVTNP